MDEKIIISIGRQYGSGGREIGSKLAQKLGIPYYDRELIGMASEKSGISKELLEHADEKAANPFLYSMALGTTARGQELMSDYCLPINDQLFIVQAEIIKQLATEKSCIIVGRCADSVLRDDPHLFSVFVSADMEHRIDRIADRNNLSSEKAKKLLQKVDKHRRAYYNYYTDRQWGEMESYDLCVNSSKLGIERTVDLLAQYAALKRGI